MSGMEPPRNRRGAFPSGAPSRKRSDRAQPGRAGSGDAIAACSSWRAGCITVQMHRTVARYGAMRYSPENTTYVFDLPLDEFSGPGSRRERRPGGCTH